MDRKRLTLAFPFIAILVVLGGWLIYSAIIRSKNTFPIGSPPLDLKNSIPQVTVDMPKMRPPAIRPTDFMRYGGTTSSASIVLFGDYGCRQCLLMEKTIREILPKYRGLVRYVWRDLPKDNNQQALNAAVFANCAGIQGKFWPVHDALMAAPSLDEFTLSNITTQFKLDQKSLSSCRIDPMTEASIRSDANAVGGDGVTSTPILFIGTEATKDTPTPTELDKKIKTFLGS